MNWNKDELFEIAKWQRWTIYSIIASWVGRFVLGALSFPINLFAVYTLWKLSASLRVNPWWVGGVLMLSVVGMVATLTGNQGVGVLLLLLAVIGNLGGLVWLNARATKILTQAGVKVGFLGANPNDVTALP